MQEKYRKKRYFEMYEFRENVSQYEFRASVWRYCIFFFLIVNINLQNTKGLSGANVAKHQGTFGSECCKTPRDFRGRA